MNKGFFIFPACFSVCWCSSNSALPDPILLSTTEETWKRMGECKRCEAAAINGGGGVGIRHLQVIIAQAGAAKASFVEVRT